MSVFMKKLESLLERRFDLIGALIIAGLFAFLFQDKQVPATFGTLIDASVNISAIAVGFLLTAKTILLGANDQKIVQRLKELGVFSRLMDYFIAAIWWCFLSTLASAGLIFFDSAAARTGWAAAWMFIAGGAVFSCLRAIRIFNSVLREFH